MQKQRSSSSVGHSNQPFEVAGHQLVVWRIGFLEQHRLGSGGRTGEQGRWWSSRGFHLGLGTGMRVAHMPAGQAGTGCFVDCSPGTGCS